MTPVNSAGVVAAEAQTNQPRRSPPAKSPAGSTSPTMTTAGTYRDNSRPTESRSPGGSQRRVQKAAVFSAEEKTLGPASPRSMIRQSPPRPPWSMHVECRAPGWLNTRGGSRLRSSTTAAGTREGGHETSSPPLLLLSQIGDAAGTLRGVVILDSAGAAGTETTECDSRSCADCSSCHHRLSRCGSPAELPAVSDRSS